MPTNGVPPTFTCQRATDRACKSRSTVSRECPTTCATKLEESAQIYRHRNDHIKQCSEKYLSKNHGEDGKCEVVSTVNGKVNMNLVELAKMKRLPGFDMLDTIKSVGKDDVSLHVNVKNVTSCLELAQCIERRNRAY